MLPNIPVSVGGQQQLQSSSVRDLGVIYDQHLSMTQHVNSMITRNSRRSHITPVLKELRWLPVHRRIQYKIMSQTFRVIHHQAPDYLSDLLSIHWPTRSLRSECTISLTVPRTRTATYGDRTFAKAASTLWNYLPANIRNSNSCASFERQLKAFLFLEEYTK